MKDQIIIGVSSCLLGNEVRYDGGHKRDRYITDVLSQYFKFTAFCPEVAIGLGVPRPTIRLISMDDKIRLVDEKNGASDFTQKMNQTADDYCKQLGNLSGYILKSKSPSCGMERVNLYQSNGYARKEGVGIFADRLMANYPCLPVEEEGRLNDANIRENFIERVFAFSRWQGMLADGLTVNALQDFHRRHKFILLAHEEKSYRQLGKLVAEVDKNNLENQADQYLSVFSEAMKKHATRKQHVNVLQHLMGFLKSSIDSDDKQELLDIFDNYKRGEVPLIVPLTLLNHHFRRHPQPYINEQLYLLPYPEEMMLRNHV